MTLLLVMFALAARKAEKVAVESIDTAQQTPQDYSVGHLIGDQSDQSTVFSRQQRLRIQQYIIINKP